MKNLTPLQSAALENLVANLDSLFELAPASFIVENLGNQIDMILDPTEKASLKTLDPSFTMELLAINHKLQAVVVELQEFRTRWNSKAAK